jgi:hypothetical protein
MIIAKRNPEDDSKEYLLRFIQNVLEGDQRYFHLVEAVLLETRKHLEGHTDYFTIKREMFNHVLWLKYTCGDFILSMNLDEITDEDLDILYTVLKEEHENRNCLFTTPLRNPCEYCGTKHAEYACDAQVKDIRKRLKLST